MTAKLVVGLGNPGKEYTKTRHNFGARVVARLSQVPGVRLVLPTVNMNDSGQAVVHSIRNTPVSPQHILLIHDELELLLGEMKFQAGGSARGHKGVRSVQAVLGTTDIPRLRLGIGCPPAGQAVSDYVLQNFTAEEEKVVARVVADAVAWLTDYLHQE